MPEYESADRSADRATWRVRGEPLVPGAGAGPLLGLGVAVKDLYAVRGHATGAGVPAWLAEQQPATRNAPAVQALLDAGAHVVGIAETDEFAYSIAGINSHYGAPLNPRAPHATVGGSSSGPAGAVARGQADIGLGTDTAGSIRVPASYAGLVGLRTTSGLVDMAGTVALAPQFDAAGWLTRDIATALAVCDVLIPPPVRRPLEAARTIRVPTLRGGVVTAVDDAVDACVRALVTAGVLPPVDEVDVPGPLLDSWFAAFRVVQGRQAWQERGEWITAHPGVLGDAVAERYAVAARIGRDEAEAAAANVAECARRLGELLEDGVLVLAATATPATPLSATKEQVDGVRAATLRLTSLASTAGLPAVSLPAITVDDSWQPHPLPVGLSLVTGPGTDRGLLELAGDLEAALR